MANFFNGVLEYLVPKSATLEDEKQTENPKNEETISRDDSRFQIEDHEDWQIVRVVEEDAHGERVIYNVNAENQDQAEEAIALLYRSAPNASLDMLNSTQRPKRRLRRRKNRAVVPISMADAQAPAAQAPPRAVDAVLASKEQEEKLKREQNLDLTAHEAKVSLTRHRLARSNHLRSRDKRQPNRDGTYRCLM